MNKNIYYRAIALGTLLYVSTTQLALAVRNESGDSANEVDTVSQSAITDTTQQIENIGKQIKDLATVQQNNFSDMNTFFYIALGVAVVALLLALVALFVTFNKSKNLQRQVDILLKVKQSMDSEQKLLNGKIEGLRGEIHKLQSKKQEIQETHTEAVKQQPQIPTEKPAIPPVKHEPTEEELYQGFVAAYNHLRNDAVIGIEARRNQRNDFLQKYHVQGIACTNYTQRRVNPELLPNFQATDIKNAHYLAYQLPNGNFAVVPMLKGYEEQYHYAVGAKEVFESNFQNGSYNKITVKRPAIFSSLDTVAKKGELVLQK